MKIVVIGGGKVGGNICKELSDICDIVLIDSNPDVIESIFEELDIQAIVGNGAFVDVQIEAGMKDTDFVLAVTNSDEQNIMACILAKSLGVKKSIARVRNPEYHQNVDFIKKAFGIDAMINPELETASVIRKILSFPMALNIDSFAEGKVSLVEIEIKKGSVLENMDLKTFRESFAGNILVSIVERNDEIIIPRGDTVLKTGDRIHITGSSIDLDKLYPRISQKQAPVRSVVIVGAGKIGYYLIKKLSKSRSFQIKVIEQKKERADIISRQFPNVIVINADGSNQRVLEEEGISEYDACIALTGIDEENIFISLFAQHKGVRKCITKVNRRSMLKILAHVNLDSIITPELIIADEIIRFTKSLMTNGSSNIEHLYKLAGGGVEAIEFVATSNNKTAININLTDLRIIDNTLVSLIVRDGEPILPKGNDCIKLGDRVLIITTHTDILSLDDIVK